MGLLITRAEDIRVFTELFAVLEYSVISNVDC